MPRKRVSEMPFVEVSVVEGRPPEQIRRLIHRLHSAVREALGVPDANIRVIIREVPATHWAAGDMTIEERDRGRQA